MDLGIDYNAEDHKPLEPREPVPPGKYEAQIVESTVDPTKAGNGTVLKLVWQITGGEYERRKVFDRVNLQNPSEQATEIGRRQLSSICRAIGKMRISDSAELHDQPIIIDVKIKPADGQYPAGNEIRGYYPLNGETPEPAAAAAPAATAPAPAKKPAIAGAGAGGKPPWARK